MHANGIDCRLEHKERGHRDMRLFFAIEFNDCMKDYLFDVQKKIRLYCTAGNFSAKENFHLTLRFMGEQNPLQLQALKSALRHTARAAISFELRLEELGKFDRGNRKILWVGLQQSSGLKSLYLSLEKELAKLGYEKEERGFNAHITLAREVRTDGFDALAEKLDIEKKVITVNSISLMESTRIENKLTYIALARNELNQ